MTLLSEARVYVAAGISVIPCSHRTKRPVDELLPLNEEGKPTWKPFQSRIADSGQLERWFSGERVQSMAAIGGAVSGGLLIIDFDVAGYYERWRERAGGMADGLPVQRTGGGGFQVFLRCPDPGGNRKLAWEPKEPEVSGREIAIETRGEGGYALVPPSLHPTGNRYAWVNGGPESIPVLDQARADALLDIARALDRAPYTRQEMESQERRAREAKPKPRRQGGQASVIDAFNAKYGIEEMLERHGYTRRGPYFCRPGAPDRHSVLIHNNKSFHFSSNDILHSPHLVDPFDVFLAYEHGGSITDAVRAAADLLGLRSGGARQNVPPPENNGPPTPEAEEKRAEPLREAGLTGEDGYHFTDTGCARRLLSLYGDQVRYNEEPYGKWLWWNGSHWQFDTTNKIFEYVDKMVTELYHKASETRKGDYRDSLVNLARGLEGMKRQNSLVAKTKTMQGIAVSADMLDADPWLFNVANGTLDLTGDEVVFREHRQEDYLTRSAPVSYDAGSKCPCWEKFLGEIFAGDAEIIQFMQRAVGYSLTGDISEQCLFFAYGTGANGKSVFFNAVELLLGEFFYRAPAEMILQQKNQQIPADVANLKGKRFVITSELEENRRLAEARVKSLTGGDPIEARKLYGDWFVFQPTHKLWMYGNHKPIITGSDEGIWRRVKVIPFTVTIPEENRRPMREMLDEFREERSGILNWALEGYRRYREAGFNVPTSMKTAGSEYRSEMDILGQFILECAVVNRGIESNGKQVWQAYRGWCDERGEHALAGTRFYQKLRERGFEVKPGHANKTLIYGLGLSDSAVIG